MKATQFTPEQESALQSLEQAIASPDLHAIGHCRKHQAHRSVAHWFKQVERLGVADAPHLFGDGRVQPKPRRRAAVTTVPP